MAIDFPAWCMTSAPAPPAGPTTGHPVLRLVSSLSGALDRIAHVPMWSMSISEQREALVELAKQRRRLEELELQLLLQAERDGIGADSGAVGAAAWLAHATKTTVSSRHRGLHLATKLDGGFAATRTAL